MKERGLALALAIMTALVCGIFAYALLLMATSQARHARFYRSRSRSLAASEAGLVYAREQLLRVPTWCGDPGFLFDSDDDGVKETTVVITVTNCGAGNSHAISAQVVY